MGRLGVSVVHGAERRPLWPCLRFIAVDCVVHSRVSPVKGHRKRRAQRVWRTRHGASHARETRPVLRCAWRAGEGLQEPKVRPSCPAPVHSFLPRLVWLRGSGIAPVSSPDAPLGGGGPLPPPSPMSVAPGGGGLPEASGGRGTGAAPADGGRHRNHPKVLDYRQDRIPLEKVPGPPAASPSA